MVTSLLEVDLINDKKVVNDMFKSFTYIAIFDCFLWCGLGVNSSDHCSACFLMMASYYSSFVGPSIPFGSFLDSYQVLIFTTFGRVDLPFVDPWVCQALEGRASEVSDCYTCRSARYPSDYLASIASPVVPYLHQGY